MSEASNLKPPPAAASNEPTFDIGTFEHSDPSDFVGMNETTSVGATDESPKQDFDVLANSSAPAGSPSAPADIENGASKGDSTARDPDGLLPASGASANDGPAPEQSADPTAPPQVPKKTKRPRREVNPDLQEFQQTGKWGRVKKSDCIVAAVLALVVIAAAVVVAVVVSNNKSTKKTVPISAAPIPLPPTLAPSLAPKVSPAVQLAAVLRIIGNNTYTNASLQNLPNNVAYYKGLASDTTQAYQVRAMSWLLQEDTLRHLQGVEFRYSLAALYFAWGGSSWTNATNWLKGVVSCDWFGVECDIVTGDITELSLPSNNIVGTIPNELALLTDLVSLNLARNDLQGTLQADAIGSLPVLSILNLASNSFTGYVPDGLARNGVLQSLYIQFNNFTGFLPNTYCNSLKQIALDCKKVEFSVSCRAQDNCY